MHYRYRISLILAAFCLITGISFTVASITAVAANGPRTAFVDQLQEFFGVYPEKAVTKFDRNSMLGSAGTSDDILPTSSLVDTVIAGWDFFGQSSPTTVAATTFDANLVSSSGANNVTRGPGASASTASNSFRTTGFQNNGISTSNTDYFQITLTAASGFKQSLSAIDARYAGTSSFAVSPGVSAQYAYSLDGTNFTLIGSPSVTVGSPATQTQINLTGISALQNVSSGTTITIRYYASGQTTTGGWGFNSPAAGQNGLAITGSVTPSGGSAPVISSPTANGATSNSATIGATISSDGGSTITERGTVWKTTAGVTATDNPLAEGGTATGAFSHLRSSLPAGSQIFYRGYAINGTGTGLSTESSFYTLSNEPAVHAASFTGAPFSSTQVDLTFSAASTITDAAGYIILRRSDGTFPDATGVVDATAPGSLSLPVGTTLVTTISNNSITAFSDTGLTNNTQYRYVLIPFGYNGTNAATYNYRTGAAIPTATVTTAAASSDVVAIAASESATISSLINDAGPLTSSTGAQVWQITVRDGGAAPDGDSLPTIITALTIGRGTSSVVTSFAATILAADLFDGATNVGSAVIAANSLSFTGLNISAPDDGTKTLSLRISLKTSGLVDNQAFQFDLASAGVTTAGAVTSSQVASFAAIASDQTKNKIDVAATKLAFGTQPVNAGTGQPMPTAPTVYAADVNGNTDLDYATNIGVTATGSVLTGSPVSVAPGAGTGTATFTGLTFTTAANGVTLTAASGALANATSGTFNVVLLPLPGEIVINQISPDYNGASNEYVEIVNLTNKTFDLSLLRLEYQSSSGSGGSAGGLLSGTLQPYSFWLLSPDASITAGQTVALPRDGSITAGFAGAAGQLALRLASAPNTKIDGVGYGTLTGGTFVEGTAAVSPPTDGGIARISDGVDTDSNVADFQAVSNANIYLRNSGSRIVPTGVSLAAGTYTSVSAQNNSSLGGDVSVTGRLTLGGILSTAGSTLSLGCASTVVGAGAAAYVDGAVLKDFCSTGSFSYPVGQGAYSPVAVTVTALATNPSGLKVTPYDAPLGGFPTDSSLSRNWNLEETGDLTADLLFYYDASDVNGDETDYRVYKRAGNGVVTSECSTPATCVDSVNHILGPVAGVSSFSRWTGAGPLAPTAADVSIAGRVTTADGRGISNAVLVLTGNSLPQPMRVMAGPFGYYQFDGLEAGEVYVVTVGSKRFRFIAPNRVVTLADSVTDIDFVASPQE